MFVRRRTVERLLADRERAFAKERQQYVDLIREQNDRLMHLVGRPWTLPPRPVDPEPEREPGPDDYLEDL